MARPRYFLGVHCGHNASCAVMKNGVIVAAAEEERFTRIKNDCGYPKMAIEYCMKKARIIGADLERAAYATVDIGSVLLKAKTGVNFSLQDYYDYYGEKYYLRRFKGEKCLDYLRWLRDADRFKKGQTHFDYSFATDKVICDGVKDSELFRKERIRMLSEHVSMPASRIGFLDHHTCHAYYAYFGSLSRGHDCAIVTLDSYGDGRNQTVWVSRNDKLKLVAESNENDICRIYKMATLILGMRPDQHEYKVMGLAPYAKKAYIQESLDVIKDLIKVDGMRILHKERPKDLFNYLRKGWTGHRFDNIAGAVQAYTEYLVKRLIENIYKETGIRRFVLSGGVSLNVKMNKVISELPCVSSLFVCGSGGDESLSIGACYYLNKDNRTSKPLDHMYLGYDIDEDLMYFDWKTVAKSYRITKGVSHSCIARLLAKGDIVARVEGRTEFGARALGHRSILADPSKADSVKKINEAIKNRDFWMPFALSILREHADKYIHNPKSLQAPYMTIAFDTLPKLYDSIRAGTHPYDRTVRPQLVEKRCAPLYHDLINAFYRHTGIPALLNTSLNLHGEPIVNNIYDALRTFELSEIDHLLIDKVLISKSKPLRGNNAGERETN